MNDNNEKEKKGGFLSALSGLFRGGSSVAGGISSGAGSAGIGSGVGSASGLAGLFATKAGIVGMVLGGATIATGVMVVSTFMGPSSAPVNTAELFQNSYLEEESSKAGLERTKSRDSSAAASSSLDMFSEQAKRDGLGGLAAEAGEGGKADASADAPAAPADSSADAPAAPPGNDSASGGSGAGAPKMQASAGFGGKGGSGGGSSGTSIPRMQGGGGLSGGIGQQFQAVNRSPVQANGGKFSGMTASAARVKNSPKYSVPNVNKKGAYGQAKYAGKMGAKAAYSADGAGSRTEATNAFSGETTGSGDVATPEMGAGLGGAGVSNGAALKANDPSLNSNESTVPKVPKPEDVDPWQAEEDAAMNGMMWAFGMIIVTKLLSNLAKKATIPWLVAALYIAAMAAAAVAIYYAFKVVMAGYAMYSTYGQKMMGGIYMLTGVMLMLKALEALGTAASGAGGAGVTAGTTAGVNGATATVAGTGPVLGSGIGGACSSLGSGLSGIGSIMGPM